MEKTEVEKLYENNKTPDEESLKRAKEKDRGNKMKQINWSEEDLDKFCEDNFIADSIAEKLQVFMKGQEGSIELIPKKGDEDAISNLKINVVLSVE